MSSVRPLYINLILVISYLAALQIWFRLQGDTQRIAAVAIMVIGFSLVALHIMVLTGRLIAYYIRKDHLATLDLFRTILLTFLVGFLLSYANGVIIQL